MWKHTNWLLLEPDAKDGGDSSPSPADAKAVSSTETAAPEAADPRAELNKALAAIVEKHEVPEEPVAPEAVAPEEPQEEGKPSEPEPKAEPEAELPPFHEHPRWKELQAKMADTTRELESLKPLAERQQQVTDYCARFNISEEQMQDALRMAALLNNDPLEAQKALQPIWEALSRYSGERLPDDLAQKVKDGLVDEATAKEMATLRGRLAATEKRRELDQRSSAEQLVQAKVRAVNQWEANKMATDPDFKQKAELVADRYVALVRAKQPGSPEAAVALAEQALADVNARLGVFIPKKPAGRPGPNGVTVRREMAPPKTALEAAQRALAKHEKD